MFSEKDNTMKKVISDLLSELDNFERTAARTIDRNELDIIEDRLQQLIQQMRDLAASGENEN
jgi:molecular chaperone GrpE (heat shock protein)